MPPPLPNISEARPPHVLLYSPFWMDTIFKPRARAEELLSPEREAGNLTPRDYDATIEFLSNYHRQYPVIFSAIGFALFLPFRSLKLAPFKRASIGFALGSGGFTCGKIAFLVSHFDYMNCLEKPHGFHKAMENIQAQVGSPKDGVFMQRVYELSPDDMDPDQVQANIPQLTLPKASDNNSPPSPPVTAPRTRWDEIRAANHRNVQNSSWDKLRQAHERNQIKSEEFMGDLFSEKIDGDPYDNPHSRRLN